MKKTKKIPLWYNSVGEGRRSSALEWKELSRLTSDREGRAMLESYCRIYRMKL